MAEGTTMSTADVAAQLSAAQQIQLELMTLQVAHDSAMASMHAVQKASDKIRG